MSTKPPTPWLSCYKARPNARLRLFCFPYAGAGGSIFKTWQDALPEWIEVWPMEPPGHWCRMHEPLIRDIPGMVASIAAGINAYLDRPFALFGHSLGALVTFELTRYLRLQQDIHPLHLFISARKAPHLPSPIEHSPIHVLPDVQFLEHLDNKYNGIPRVLRENPELLEIALPIAKADIQALETYTYADEQPFACGISVFGGDKDRTTSQDDLDAWRQHTLGCFSRKIFGGDHFYFTAEQTQLLVAIAEDLAGINQS